MTDGKFKLGVLVSGRGSNLQALIDSIERGELTAEISLVISDKSDAPAIKRCQQHQVDYLCIDPKSFNNKKNFELTVIDRMQEKSVDLICLAGFMRILGKIFIEAFPRKIINIHPSLLPSFPGLNAQHQALDHGVKYSGCTVHYVDEGMDSGPIIAQTTVPVQDHDTVETLSIRILEQEHLIYPKAIQSIIDNQIMVNGRKVIFKPGSAHE